MTDRKAEDMIEDILKSKTRENIIRDISQFGGDIDWDDWTTRQILEEVWRSDCEAGEEDSGILISLYYN